MSKKSLTSEKSFQLDVEQKVMSKITSGAIKMKPRWYFIMGSLLLLFGLIGISLAVIFFTHLTIFALRQHGPMAGIKLQVMLANFPWWLPMITIILIGLAIILLKMYDFSYKKNFSFIVILFLLAILISQLIIDQLQLSRLWWQNRQGRMLIEKMGIFRRDVRRKKAPAYFRWNTIPHQNKNILPTD